MLWLIEKGWIGWQFSALENFVVVRYLVLYIFVLL